MKAVVFAYHDMGCTGIQALLDAGYDIAAIFTHPDNPGENHFFGSVARIAAEQGIPVWAPEDVNHPLWIERLREIKPDVLFSFYYRNLLCEDILKTSDFAGEQRNITGEKLGENHVYFLPYLMGERSPINDTNARGTFTGITMDTTRADLVQAVLEGVAFAIRDSFEVAKSLGIEIPRSNICGGGAKSPLWRRIFANVLGIPLDMVKTEQGPGYGAAMLAMVGCGRFASVQEAADALVEVASTTEPDPVLTAKYEARYQSFKKLYPALKDFFASAV